MKKQPFKLTEELISLWKQCTIGYLKKLYPKFPPELEEAFLKPDVLTPVFKYAGEFLLKPGDKVLYAYYLKKGLAKSYVYDEDSNAHILYIWDAGSIIVLYDAFRQKLKVNDCYIELMEDCELVAISSFDMDEIYRSTSRLMS